MNKTDKNKIPFKKIASQPFVIQLGILIGKVMPRKMGLKLASWIGTLLGKNRNNPMVKAIRANQWVIHQQTLTDEQLDEFPKIIFRSSAKCIFDYFYFLPRPEKLQEVIDFGEETKVIINRIQEKKPCVVVCPHLSNFDLMGYALALNQVDVQVLSYPNPNASYKLQNKLRESLGLTVTPMSISAFRQASQRLRNGGSILTGFDRPLNHQQHEKYKPKFFGYETNLPVTYVRMAKEANAPVIIMAATSQPGGRYALEGSNPIWMESDDDLETETLKNASKVLSEAEKFIKKHANQWAMFYPVWPQFLGV
jgi:lauroyl/myristoyl acyltransferase